MAKAAKKARWICAGCGGGLYTLADLERHPDHGGRIVCTMMETDETTVGELLSMIVRLLRDGTYVDLELAGEATALVGRMMRGSNA